MTVKVRARQPTPPPPPGGGSGGASTDRKPTFGSATVSDQTYTAGEDIDTVTLPRASGGDGTLRYSLSPAPPNGLNFNASNRSITGTPTVALAARQYTYTAQDTDGDTATLNFSITVNEAAQGGDQQRDLMPTFGTQTIADQTYTAGQDIGTVTLPQATGGDAPLNLQPLAGPSGRADLQRQDPHHHRRLRGGPGRKAVHLYDAGR